MTDPVSGCRETRPRLLLVPSPLLGPATWSGVAEKLVELGWPVLVHRPPDDLRRPEQLSASLCTLLGDGKATILVPHSNAGLIAPSVVDAGVLAVVYVDAALLPPSGSATAAPAGFLDFLQAQADNDGLLPVWTDWWDPSDVSGLFPDQVSRARVERQQRRLPLSYFTSLVEVPDAWAERPSAYLAFGDTYADELAQAVGYGWPTSTLADAAHLHMLQNPAEVVAALVRLVDRLALQSR